MRGRMVIGVTFLGVALAACSSSTQSSSHENVSFDARPVLCHAPLEAAVTKTTTAPLPSCAPEYQTTVARLHVRVATNTYVGYTANVNVAPDPQFASYPSTPASQDLPSETVLLPPAPSNSEKVRYVLGPVVFTRSEVKLAVAYDEGGVWVDNIVLTPKGATAWDAYSKANFHGLVAFVLDGKVLPPSFVEPTQSQYTPDQGIFQIDVGLSEQGAKNLAAELS